MITLEHVYICNDDTGEIEGMFRDGKLVQAWSCNDGLWRGEYFNPLLAQLGFNVVYREPTADTEKQLRDWFGL